MSSAFAIRDGDIYVDGVVSFAGLAGSGVIVRGTGAYAGLRGSFTSTEEQDVLHLLR
jgi:hypothetical protein